MTKEMKKIFGIFIRKGKAVTEKDQFYIEDLLRNLISMVYLQVRDTVAAEIHDDLSTQIKKVLRKYLREDFIKTLQTNLIKNYYLGQIVGINK